MNKKIGLMEFIELMEGVENAERDIYSNNDGNFNAYTFFRDHHFKEGSTSLSTFSSFLTNKIQHVAPKKLIPKGADAGFLRYYVVYRIFEYIVEAWNEDAKRNGGHYRCYFHIDYADLKNKIIKYIWEGIIIHVTDDTKDPNVMNYRKKVYSNFDNNIVSIIADNIINLIEKDYTKICNSHQEEYLDLVLQWSKSGNNLDKDKIYGDTHNIVLNSPVNELGDIVQSWDIKV